MLFNKLKMSGHIDTFFCLFLKYYIVLWKNTGIRIKYTTLQQNYVSIQDGVDCPNLLIVMMDYSAISNRVHLLY